MTFCVNHKSLIIFRQGLVFSGISGGVDSKCVYLLHIMYLYLEFLLYPSFILFMFIYFSFHFKVDLVGNRLSASTRYRGSRESLQSGMTYSARKNSQSSMYNGTTFFLIFI